MAYYYRTGDVGIIILCTHDGNQSFGLTRRKKIYSNSDFREHFILANDINTRYLSNKMRSDITSYLGKEPYLLINNIDRKYLDLNRPLQLGTSNRKSESYWNNFHNKLQSIITECKNKFGYCLLLDIHGNANTENLIQLGYGVSFKEIERGVCQDLSLQQLKMRYSPLSLTHGNRSLGKFLDDYLMSVPSPRMETINKMKIIAQDDKYYKGGFITQFHSKNSEIDAIQIEISPDLRNDSKLEYTSNVISHGITHFFIKNY